MKLIAGRRSLAGASHAMNIGVTALNRTKYNGLAILEDTTWRVYNTSNSSLPNNSIAALVTCGENLGWIGTNNGGGAVLEDTTWILYDQTNSGLTCDSLSVLELDNSGSLWIGTPSGGLINFTGTVGIERDDRCMQHSGGTMTILSNPCRGKISLEYSIKEKTFVSIQVYDITGRRVKTLVQGHCDRGAHQINWFTKDLSAGIYFIRMNTPYNIAMRKLVLVK